MSEMPSDHAERDGRDLSEYGQLRAKVQRLEGELEEAREDAARWVARAAEKDRRIAELETSIISRSEADAAAAVEVEAIAKRITEECREEVANEMRLERKVAALQQQLQERDAVLSGMRRTIAAQETALEVLRGNVVEANAIATAWRTDCGKREQRIADLEDVARRAAADQHSELVRRTAAQEAITLHYIPEIASLKAELANAQNEASIVRRSYLHEQSVVDALKAELEEANTVPPKLTLVMTTLERELAEAKAEIERLSKYISPEQFAQLSKSPYGNCVIVGGQLDKDATGSARIVEQGQSLAETVETTRKVLAESEAECERLRTMSTVEMMCENLNVRHHVLEWESRCFASEAEVRRLRWALTAIGSCSSDARTCELAELALSAKAALNPEVPHA